FSRDLSSDVFSSDLRDCEALVGKSTLNRLELFPQAGQSIYHKIVPDTEALERLFVELFLDSHAQAPKQIVLDLDATDVPLHGEQDRKSVVEGRKWGG